jgi:hypothetical protein
VSALPAIEDRLIEIFTDALADEKTKVVYGYAEAPELVALFGAEFDRDFRLLGPQPVPLEESWTLEVIVEVLRPSGRDMKPAADRVWELFAVIEDALREDIGLDGVTISSRFQKGSREFFQTDKQQGCRVRTTLAGTARI